MIEFNVKPSLMVKELEFGQRIANRKSTIPILTHVSVATLDDQTIAFGVTDTVTALKSQCHAKVVRPGSCVMPARKLYEIVKTLPAEADLKIVHDGASATLTCGGYRGRLQSLPAADFPSLPEPDGLSAVLPRATLKDLLERTRYATAKQDQRYFLDGVRLEITNDSITCASTDSHRLSTSAVGFAGPKDPILTIVQNDIVDELIAMLDGEGEVDCTLGASHLFFEADGRCLVQTLPAGQFPAWRRIVPSRDAGPTVEKDSLEAIIRRIMLMSDGARSRTIDFTFNNGTLSVTSSSQQFGDASEDLPLKYGDGVKKLATSLAVNGGFVLDFLDASGTQAVELSVVDEGSPLVMRPVGAAVEHVNVMMPVRR
jgi:DNA polymerase-3 subunit beta